MGVLRVVEAAVEKEMEAEAETSLSRLRLRDVEEGTEAAEAEEMVVAVVAVLERVRRVDDSASMTAAVSRAIREVRMLLPLPVPPTVVGRMGDLIRLCDGSGEACAGS